MNTPDPERRKTVMDERNGIFVLYCLNIHSTAPFILDKQVWVTVCCYHSLRKKAGGQLPQKIDITVARHNSMPVVTHIYPIQYPVQNMIIGVQSDKVCTTKKS